MLHARRLSLGLALLIGLTSGSVAQDRYFTYYNSWSMGSDNQWSLGNAFYISTKTFAANLGNITHVMIFMERDIVRGDYPPYLTITKDYADNAMAGGVTKSNAERDSLNFLWNGWSNPQSGLTSWQNRGGIYALRDSLHAKGRYLLMTIQAVNAALGLNDVIKDSVKTEIFTRAVARYVNEHNLDGCDLNTEQNHTFTPDELTRFFRILRRNMPRPKLLTTVPLPTQWAKYANAINDIDFVLPQFYAYNQNWQPNTICAPSGSNGVFLKAPLRREPFPPGSNHQDLTTWGPVQWYQAGWPKDKIVILLSNEATPARGVDSMFSCIGTSGLPFWPDTAAYAMLSRGGTMYWDSVHIGSYIKGTATSAFTSRGVKIDSLQKFFIPILSDRNIDTVVSWGKSLGFNNYGLYDVSTDARTPAAIKMPRHHFLGTRLTVTPTSVESPRPVRETPEGFNLWQNFPNPFNPSTSISYTVARSTSVMLRVYDLQGRLIDTLVNQRDMDPGTYTVDFNASGLSSGTYIVSLEFDKTRISKRMVLMK